MKLLLMFVVCLGFVGCVENKPPLPQNVTRDFTGQIVDVHRYRSMETTTVVICTKHLELLEVWINCLNLDMQNSPPVFKSDVVTLRCSGLWPDYTWKQCEAEWPKVKSPENRRVK